MLDLSVLRCDVHCIMGLSSWIPGRRPRKVDHAYALASDVAVVMIVFFGNLGGNEQATRDHGGGGASAITSPRS
jgi:hypothetical protein